MAPKASTGQNERLHKELARFLNGRPTLGPEVLLALIYTFTVRHNERRSSNFHVPSTYKLYQSQDAAKGTKAQHKLVGESEHVPEDPKELSVGEMRAAEQTCALVQLSLSLIHISEPTRLGMIS